MQQHQGWGKGCHVVSNLSTPLQHSVFVHVPAQSSGQCQAEASHGTLFLGAPARTAPAVHTPSRHSACSRHPPRTTEERCTTA